MKISHLTVRKTVMPLFIRISGSSIGANRCLGSSKCMDSYKEVSGAKYTDHHLTEWLKICFLKSKFDVLSHCFLFSAPLTSGNISLIDLLFWYILTNDNSDN